MPRKTTKTGQDYTLEAVGPQSVSGAKTSGRPAAKTRVKPAAATPAVGAKSEKPAVRKSETGTTRKTRNAKALEVHSPELHPADAVSQDLVTREMEYRENFSATVTEKKRAASNGSSTVSPSWQEPEFPTEAERAEIERVAYGYWEQRGYQPGDPFEDWLRAESEVRSRRPVLALA